LATIFTFATISRSAYFVVEFMQRKVVHSGRTIGPYPTVKHSQLQFL